MKKNNKAFSLVLAIVLTIIMSLIALYIINYIVPFSRNVKWIENVAKAYYEAQKWVEDSLYFIKWNFWIDKIKNFSTNNIDYSYNIIALWKVLPPAWKWNSEYNKNFNRIRVWEPIQLQVWNHRLDGSNWNNINFTFKIPEIDSYVNSWSTLSWASTNMPIINWQLVAQDDVLNASWSQILASDLSSLKNWLDIFYNKQNNSWIYYKNWVKLDWTSEAFQDFFDANCTWTNSWCILKMSVINKLETTSWVSVPYLEWKIDLTSTSKNIPLRYTQITAEWKSYWYKKSISIRVPEQTVNEAFDFTVFQ